MLKEEKETLFYLAHIAIKSLGVEAFKDNNYLQIKNALDALKELKEEETYETIEWGEESS